MRVCEVQLKVVGSIDSSAFFSSFDETLEVRGRRAGNFLQFTVRLIFYKVS